VHVVVTVDDCAGNGWAQLSFVAHEPCAQFVRVLDSRARQLSANSLVAESRINLIEGDRRPASQQNQILAFRHALHAKHCHVWEDLMKSRQNRSQTLRRKLIDLQPLHEHTVIFQTFAPERKEFSCEKIRDAGHPGMTGLADDQIVPLRIYAQDIAKEFGYQIRAFHHAVEAYKIADLLKANGTGAAEWADWGGFKMEANDSVKANLAITEAKGARAMIHSDSALGAQRLNQEVAKAMYAGRAAGIMITEDQAIRWLTINPAWALGLDDKIGSIEVGKNADVVLWSGNPFSIYSKAEKVWIDGAMLFDRADATEKWRTDFELGVVKENN
jgi:predicted amidohydrolase YtcJ